VTEPTVKNEIRDGMKFITVDMGDMVVCDFCNEEWTTRTESGGYFFDGYSVCPDCGPSHKKRPKGSIMCIPGMSFADWVRKVLRADPASETIIKVEKP
jgi:hypothetical protein